MFTSKKREKASAPSVRQLIQRRVNARIDHLRPHRWNWHAIVQPLDQSLERQAEQPLTRERLRGLRYFWLDGLFAAISENFYVGFVTLFALAYGATNGQVGLVTAVANLMGALSLFPGARLVERLGQRKPLVVWSIGGIGRVVLLVLAIFPFILSQPGPAIVTIILLNGLRAFMGNLGNPAWTAIVADLVPDFMRGRYFGSRNMAMGLAALIVAPVAGRLINVGNDLFGFDFLGYQAVFFLAFVAGMVSTFSFRRIVEPPATVAQRRPHQRGDLRQALKRNPQFVGFVAGAFIFNLALQTAAPFFNVYLVSELGATTGMVGLLASVSSLTALFGQQLFGRLLDRKDAYWVLQVSGFILPVLPFAWIFITAPWHVTFINLVGGVAWAGYNLANFNLLLALTPDEQRPRAVALYQTAVFTSAVIGPLLGGYLADAVSFQLIFGLSAAGRLLGLLVFVAFVARRAKG